MFAAGRILLVEDEAPIADAIRYALATEGFQVEWKTLGRDGLAHLRAHDVELVILDVGLPDGTGFEVCKQIRTFSDVPILFLTARSQEVDRVVGLEIGADDYVVKPFSPRELAARVKAILKRARGAVTAVPTGKASPGSADFRVDEARARIYFCDVQLELTRYEYLLLKFLVEHPERVFMRSELMEQALGTVDTSLERSIDAHVKALRAKLHAIDENKDPIATHRGLGYSLEPSTKP